MSETRAAYPQDQENNEFRYIEPAWLNEVAKGLTAGAVKHPGGDLEDDSHQGTCLACRAASDYVPDGGSQRAPSGERQHEGDDGICHQRE